MRGVVTLLFGILYKMSYLINYFLTCQLNGRKARKRTADTDIAKDTTEDRQIIRNDLARRTIRDE